MLNFDAKIDDDVAFEVLRSLFRHGFHANPLTCLALARWLSP